MPVLLGVVLGLRHSVRAIQEKGYNLLEYFFPDVHRAVDAIARLDPIHFADGDLPRHGFPAVAKLDLQSIAAQNNGHAMKRIAMPR